MTGVHELAILDLNSNEVKLPEEIVCGGNSWKLSHKSKGIISGCTAVVGHYGILTKAQTIHEFGLVHSYKVSLRENIIPPMLCNDNRYLPFVLDSGASCHMTPDKRLLSNFKECSGIVSMGDESKTAVIGMGLTSILGRTILVPGLKFNLVSMSSFDS